MTKSDLEQLTLLNSEISRDLERLQELYALLTGCTSSISGLPHIGLLRGSDRTDKFVSMIDVLFQAHGDSLTAEEIGDAVKECVSYYRKNLAEERKSEDGQVSYVLKDSVKEALGADCPN